MGATENSAVDGPLERVPRPGGRERVSLHSKPAADGYAKVTTVTAGEKLRLPAPFDLALDTSSLPLPG
jgi:hypothetical protein